jgi:hypothetical protein
MSLLIVPALIDGQGKASNGWLTTPGWLELANDAFYLINSAVFQCMEYQ